MVQAFFLQTIDFPQLLYKVVDVPVCRSCRFPLSWRRGLSHGPDYLDHRDSPAAVLRHDDRCPCCAGLQVPGAVVVETVESSQLPLLRKSSFPGGPGQGCRHGRWRADMFPNACALGYCSSLAQMSTLRVSCAFVLGALLGPSRAVSGVVPFWCSHPYAAMAEDENVPSLAAFALPQFGNLDTPSLKGDFSRLSEAASVALCAFGDPVACRHVSLCPLFTSGSWLGSSLYGFLESEMDGTGSILDSNHGYGKRAS